MWHMLQRMLHHWAPVSQLMLSRAMVTNHRGCMGLVVHRLRRPVITANHRQHCMVTLRRWKNQLVPWTYHTGHLLGVMVIRAGSLLSMLVFHMRKNCLHLRKISQFVAHGRTTLLRQSTEQCPRCRQAGRMRQRRTVHQLRHSACPTVNIPQVVMMTCAGNLSGCGWYLFSLLDL